MTGAGGIAGIGSTLLKGAGSIVSGIGGLFFKGRDGGAKGGADPRVIQSQLGSGSPLDSGVKSKMESAFGQDFSNVRIHTGAKDAQISNDLNARAFTVGKDIAFSQGEYKPGTLIGDALIAHELAHTVQQGGGSSSSEPMQKGETEQSAFEEEADMSAVGAVASLWGGIKGGAREIARNAMPRLRSGLNLQRCEKSKREKEIERLAERQKSFLEKEAREEERKRLEKERQDKIEEMKKKGVKDPVVPPVDESKITVTDEAIGKAVTKTVKAHTTPDAPTEKWDDVTDKPKYIADAGETVTKIKSTAKSDPKYAEIAELLDKGTIVFSEATAKEALTNEWYAWYAGGMTMKVGMSFIEDANADPRNVFQNIVHELGGHGGYGTELANEISDEMLKRLDTKVKKSLVGTEDLRDKYYLTYVYPETEIFAELRERKWRETFASGFKPKLDTSDDPDTNIPELVFQINNVWDKEATKAILEAVVKKAKADKNIRKEDLDVLLKAIRDKTTFNIE